MELHENFNKWIAVNGSAVPEGQIALFRDYLVAAETTFHALETENSALRSEISALKDLLSKQEKIDGHSSLLEETGGRVLY